MPKSRLVALGEVVEFVSTRYPADQPSIPYLSFKGLRDDGLVEVETGRTDGYWAQVGDTVITRQGHQSGWIGKKSSIPLPFPVVAATTLLVIRPRESVRPQFLSALFASTSMRQKISHLHGERTSASLQILKALEVPLPELCEQDRILELLTPSQTLLYALSKELSAMSRTHEALLDELIFGDDGSLAK